MPDTYRLPTVIPHDARDLIEEFAHEHRLKFNDAVRQLIAESPKLVKFAKEKGKKINLDVQKPGGYRPKKE